MAFSKKHKTKMMAQYEQWLQDSEAIFFLEYQKMSMKEMDDLRTKVRETGSEIHVVKNTLLSKAFQNSGIDNFTGVFRPAINLESHFPDPILDRYCKYSTAGPHEYRFPVEAVGARALRNRQRVTNSEIGL